MMWIVQNCSIAAVLMVVAGIAAAVVWLRCRKSYQEHLQPVLEEYGFQLLDSLTPKLFNVGPFSKLQVEWGRPQSRTPMGSGEYSAYRIVTFMDERGHKHEAWAHLEFELFRLRKIEWKPSLEEIASSSGPAQGLATADELH